MRALRAVLLLALGLSAVVVPWRIARAVPDASGAAPARVTPAPPPRVALLATRPGALHTSLWFASPGDPAPIGPLATLTHAEGATARGAVRPGTTTVLATAGTAETRDASFDSSLFRLAPHAPPVRLCDGVVHASRPLVTEDGRVFVSRGAPGPEPAPGAVRVDALTVDEVDPDTGALRTVLATSGHLAFLAGHFGREIVVYRIAPGRADVVAVDPDTRATRAIVPSLPPYARDFSVDAATGTLVFQGRHERDARTWTIESVDLVTGRRARLAESPSPSLVPHALPGGGVAWSPDGRDGLAILGEPPGRGPLGTGADWVRATADDRFLGVLHTRPGTLPVPFVVDLATGAADVLPAPAGARVEIAGFVPPDGGAR